MTGEKGPDVMVRAAARVADRDVQFSMIGTGPMESQCRAIADSLGISERFVWHGSVVGAAQCMGAFDVVVLTSWTEGTPMVLLEAMASGTPVVTTDVGGIPDIVSSAEALLCRSGAVEEIGAAIRDALKDTAGARARAYLARQRLLRELAVEPWIARYRRIYRTAVGRRGY
jgi:glycosyltransferase involved in cell wall biosynthesis